MHLEVHIIESEVPSLDYLILWALKEELTQKEITCDYIHEGTPHLEIQSHCMELFGFDDALHVALIESSKTTPAICYGLYLYSEYSYDTVRILYYQGKSLTQHPEMVFPPFHENTFFYEVSNKKPLSTRT